MLVQALVAEPAVEALDVGVLDRLAGPDEVQLDAALVCPGVQHLAGELGTVVADDAFGQAAYLRDRGEDLRHAETAEGGVDLDGQRLAGEVIDDIKGAKHAAAVERVADEVHR